MTELPAKISKPVKFVLGRPTKYRDKFPQIIIDLASTCEPFLYGMSCYVHLAVSRDTFCKWVIKYELFSDAYNRGKLIFLLRMHKFAFDNKVEFKTLASYHYIHTKENIFPQQKHEIVHNFNSVKNIRNITAQELELIESPDYDEEDTVSTNEIQEETN